MKYLKNSKNLKYLTRWPSGGLAAAGGKHAHFSPSAGGGVPGQPGHTPAAAGGPSAGNPTAGGQPVAGGGVPGPVGVVDPVDVPHVFVTAFPVGMEDRKVPRR